MVLAAAAVALFLSAPWARAAAIIVTCLAIVVTFLWMPYYPTGSIVLISLDVVVIWGVATWNTSRQIGMKPLPAKPEKEPSGVGRVAQAIRCQREPR